MSVSSPGKRFVLRSLSSLFQGIQDQWNAMELSAHPFQNSSEDVEVLRDRDRTARLAFYEANGIGWAA